MKKFLLAVISCLFSVVAHAGTIMEITDTTATFRIPVVSTDVMTATKFKASGGSNASAIAYGHKDYTNTGIRFHDPEFRSIVFVSNGADQFKVGPNLVEMMGTSIFILYKGNPGVPTMTWAGDLATGWYNYSLYQGGGTPLGQVAFMSNGTEVFRFGKTEQKFYTPILVGTTTASAGIVIRSSGTIEAMAGGFKFPDGTVQTTAAVAPTGCLDHGPLSSAPSSPAPCDRYYNTGSNQMYMWNGTEWVILG